METRAERHAASVQCCYTFYERIRMLREALICEPLRTPVGRFGGVFKELPAHTLGATVIRALMARTGLPLSVVNDVLYAQCYPSMDAPALGRVVALDAGL